MTVQASGVELNKSLSTWDLPQPLGVLGADCPDPEGKDCVLSRLVAGGSTEAIRDGTDGVYDMV